MESFVQAITQTPNGTADSRFHVPERVFGNVVPRDRNPVIDQILFQQRHFRGVGICRLFGFVGFRFRGVDSIKRAHHHGADCHMNRDQRSKGDPCFPRERSHQPALRNTEAIPRPVSEPNRHVTTVLAHEPYSPRIASVTKIAHSGPWCPVPAHPWKAPMTISHKATFQSSATSGRANRNTSAVSALLPAITPSPATRDCSAATTTCAAPPSRAV